VTCAAAPRGGNETSPYWSSQHGPSPHWRDCDDTGRRQQRRRAKLAEIIHPERVLDDLERAYSRAYPNEQNTVRAGVKKLLRQWERDATPSEHLTFLEPISKSFEEDNEAGKLDKAKEIVSVVLPTNEDPALPLNPGEEALDEPASHVAA
jgi:hypothetical protein